MKGNASLIKQLNTPSGTNINAIFQTYLGIDITNEWTWSYNTVTFEPTFCVRMIDHLIKYRGKIAHGQVIEEDFNSLFYVIMKSILTQIASLSNNFLADLLKTTYQYDTWKKVEYIKDWNFLTKPVDTNLQQA